MTKKKERALRTKVRRMERAMEIGKAGYAQHDRILDELAAAMKPGESVPLGDGRQAVLVDLFAEKNQIFIGRYARRFDIKISHAADVTAKL